MQCWGQYAHSPRFLHWCYLQYYWKNKLVLLIVVKDANGQTNIETISFLPYKWVFNEIIQTAKSFWFIVWCKNTQIQLIDFHSWRWCRVPTTKHMQNLYGNVDKTLWLFAFVAHFLKIKYRLTETAKFSYLNYLSFACCFQWQMTIDITFIWDFFQIPTKSYHLHFLKKNTGLWYWRDTKQRCMQNYYFLQWYLIYYIILYNRLWYWKIKQMHRNETTNHFNII